MADFSFDSAGQLASSSLKGVTSTVAGSTSNKLLGSAAGAAGRVGGGLITGAVSQVENQVSNLVGGKENLNLLVSGANKTYDTVTGTVSALWNGETTFSEIGEKITGSVSDFLDGDVSGQAMGDAFDSLLGLGLKVSSNDLGSDWGSLSPLLMARLFVCDSKGVADVNEYQGVYGAMEDGSLEATFNWQSPFENMGPETKAPALTAMIQSGSLVPVLNALQAVNPDPSGKIGGLLDAGADKLKAAVHELEGRTGMTKLNSRQVFSGMPPVRINFSMMFRATTDAAKEVEAPLQRLMEWVFPQQLAEEGILSEVLQTTTSVDSFIKALFPSLTPKLLAFTYAGRTASPMVVESISYPLSGPKDSMGNFTNLTVQISLATLTALDRPDIKRFFAK
ncbi:hypothetical protein [Pseudomonas gingeri]|uniref:hypothetical protein n=1 Tax=Pseudomonas gingeri TaxID=117681 RepID=UPI0015A2CEAE|nr:hypothetical protein [Pseudomonas gingeri]NWA11944.1 hypothetical protein [Pseudomonas gingeri]